MNESESYSEEEKLLNLLEELQTENEQLRNQIQMTSSENLKLKNELQKKSDQIIDLNKQQQELSSIATDRENKLLEQNKKLKDETNKLRNTTKNLNNDLEAEIEQRIKRQQEEVLNLRDTPTRVLANGRGSVTVPDHRHDPSPSQRLCVAFYAIFQETDSLPSAFHPKTFYVLL